MLENGNDVTHYSNTHLPKYLLLTTPRMQLSSECQLITLQYLVEVWQHVLSDSIIIKYVCIARRERRINKRIRATILRRTAKLPQTYFFAAPEGTPASLKNANQDARPEISHESILPHKPAFQASLLPAVVMSLYRTNHALLHTHELAESAHQAEKHLIEIISKLRVSRTLYRITG